ncbi:alpha-amylase family glycosyl hydrolase [Olsenella sp. YH-ols2217]|uniref:Alpha-amylase family glycosyl hydrolase n=1 Tax=Kribbibacterium absianum TaxID=3044210 RepID=A0ABT6ZJB9_9ACTN|nr:MULTISPECIES: alpha-amylase family glycosyl hydrolase [unclassified Olsenella]MDJ1122719.1 alpha-amylase family glycosyl hydrolase [Olsenella sp. YH-ols2216]MDJ1129157.1 alpha-amylase family glycosyl hydrolase [Olsenella sp. YH-ols2217]
MAWYDEAVFYHIYPLGLTGAPKVNEHGEPEHRLLDLIPWLDHMRDINANALYIGPLFESMTHGYDTVDYSTVDARLGTNEDLATLVQEAHDRGIHVILDGVFNHVGRDFFAFQDLLEKRENSPYRDWFCNVNFCGNNSYNDGLCYDNWGGVDALVKLNQKNPAVREHLTNAVQGWVDEFDIDGLRLDAADVLDFECMHALRHLANTVKPDFWLMGEVIHGDYSRWVNGDTLHAVTDYSLHKGLYSGHNDHNYFEIAHTVKRNLDMGGGHVDGLKLYNFVDNHDVDRIASKLDQPAHLAPVHVLLYTLPGVPSIYYGSEFAVPGKRTAHADDMLRPALDLEELEEQRQPLEALVTALGAVREARPELSYGEYQELALTNRQYAFARTLNGSSVIVAVNNDEGPASVTVDALDADGYVGALTGTAYPAEDGRVTIELDACSGDVLVPEGTEVPEVPDVPAFEPETTPEAQSAGVTLEGDAAEVLDEACEAIGIPDEIPEDKPLEEWTVQELQAGVLAHLAANGPVTPQMRKDVENNVYHDSLLNWIKSFR